MPYWKKYDIKSLKHDFLFKYLQTDPEGVKNWFRYKICRRWHGKHEFNRPELPVPTPFRSKKCKRCGVVWYYAMPEPPPMLGHVNLECPRCLMVVHHNTEKAICRCYKCGKKFPFKDF